MIDYFTFIELQTQLKNAVYKEMIRLQNKVGIAGSELRPLCKEPLDFVRVAEEEWEATLRRGINTLAIEKNLPLCKEVARFVLFFLQLC